MDATKPDDWLLRLIRALTREGQQQSKERVGRLQGRHPGTDDDALANLIVKDASFWAAIAGIGAGAAASAGLSAAAVVPEVAYLTRLQALTAIQIAVVYNHSLDEDQIAYLALACIAYTYAFDQMKEVMVRAGIEAARWLSRDALPRMSLPLARAVGPVLATRFAERGLLGAVPLLSLPIGAGVNYGSMQVLGIAAIRFFSPHFRPCYNCGAVVARRAKFCWQCGTALRQDASWGALCPW